MKKALFTIGALVLTLGFASAQEPATSANAMNPNAAEITFEKETHDFGTIKQGGNGTYEFKFKNTGKEPLIITEAHGSCGCTVPTYPKNVVGSPGTELEFAL